MVHRLVVGTCFLFLTGLSVCTYACSCERVPVSYHFNNSTYVFLAEIVQIEKHDPIPGVVGGGIVKARFNVLETFKGQPLELISISSNTDGGMCGEAGMLVPGETLLVFTRNGGFGTCSGTRAYDRTRNSADIVELRRLRAAASTEPERYSK